MAKPVADEASQGPLPPRFDIVHVVENLERGGLERMVIDLALSQRSEGHGVRVACLFRPGALAPELAAEGVEVYACDKHSGADIGAVLRLRRWLGRSGPAQTVPRIVHTHNATAHYHAVLALVGRPPACLVNTRHGMGVQAPRSRK